MLRLQLEIKIVPEVADNPKVADRTFCRLAAFRKISAFKVCEAWRFPNSDIEACFRSRVADKATAKTEH